MMRYHNMLATFNTNYITSKIVEYFIKIFLSLKKTMSRKIKNLLGIQNFDI